MNKNTIAEILPWHLSEKTLSDYIRPVSTSGRAIEAPPLELPYDCYWYSDDMGETIMIEILCASPIDTEHSGNDENLPEDLVNLINWAIKENISVIKFSTEELGSYDNTELISRMDDEQFLPFYDFDYNLITNTHSSDEELPAAYYHQEP